MKSRTLILICGLAILTLHVSPANGNDKKTLTAAEIINKHIDAIGGKAAVARLKSRLVLGTVMKENEPEAQFAIASEPGRVSALFRFKHLNWRLIYDGNKGLEQPALPQQMHVVYEKYIDIVSSGLLFNDMSLFNVVNQGPEGTASFEAKGIKKLHGRPAYVVDVKRGHEGPMRLYFDTETLMWVRTDYGKAWIQKKQHMSNGSGLASENNPHPDDLNSSASHSDDDTVVDFYVETSDFRETDGVKLPFKFEQVATYPILQQKVVGTISGTVKEYVHNVTVDPKSYR